MKKVVLIIIILLLIIGGYIFYNNIKKEQTILNENKEIIKTNYQSLTDNVNNYNEIRKELNNKMTNFFYDKFLNEKTSYEEILSKYNDIITKIDNNIANINKECNTLYNDIEINKICNNYKTLYEKLINIYVNDLFNYNQKVEGYNELKKAILEKYPMLHNDYIDYDNDHVYEGKSSNEEEVPE